MFFVGFEKTSASAVGETLRKAWHDPKLLDKAGLGLLAGAAGYHTYKAIKEKDPGAAAAGAGDIAGLGLLYRAVQKAHK